MTHAIVFPLPPTTSPMKARSHLSLLVLPLFGLSPLLVREAEQLWHKNHLQFFPFVIALVAYLSYVPRSHPAAVSGVRQATGAFCCVLGVSLGLVAAWLFSPWAAHLAAIIVYFGWAQSLPRGTWSHSLALAVLLLLTLPLPFNLDEALVLWLQRASTSVLSAVLDEVGIPNLTAGVVVTLKGKTFFVDEACSGVGSLYALMATSVGLAVLSHHPLSVAVISLVSAVLWAGIGNCLRLGVIAMAWHYASIDLSHGMVHNALGICTFTFSAVCVFLTCGAAAVWLAPIPLDSVPGHVTTPVRIYNTIVQWPNPGDRSVRKSGDAAHLPWRFVNVIYTPLVVALLLSAAPTGWVLARTYRSYLTARIAENEMSSRALTLETMPATIPYPAQRVGFLQREREMMSRFGTRSSTWSYAGDAGELTASLDYPFVGWHRLYVCYENTGWRLISYEVVPVSASGGDEWPWVEMVMKNHSGDHGYVFFCFLDHNGKPYTPGEAEAILPTGDTSMIRRRFADNLLTMLQSESQQTAPPITFQFQCFATSVTPLNADSLKAFRQSFFVLRAQARQSVRNMVGEGHE